MAKLTLNNVSKIYSKNFFAVKDLNLEIKDKEFLVLVGPSGCGKSTTLRMIAGLESITAGDITIEDLVVNDMHPKDRNIAMVFQSYALYPHMNVYDNLAFGLKLRKYMKNEIKSRVSSAAKILNIEHLLYRKPKQLSGGERQRVAVGRAIVRKPKVFLFDEPLSNLDAKMRVQMRTELSKLHRRIKTTMIYVTHDQVEAMTMGNRIVVMDKGVIQQLDTPLKIYDKPANKFVAGFIGSPPMNFIRGKIIKRESSIFFESGKILLSLTPDISKKMENMVNLEVDMGIRAEDIYDRVYSKVATEANTLPALIEVVEQMGSEMFIHLRIEDKVFVAKVGPYEKLEVNQDVEVVFDMSKCHFFDVTTQDNILLIDD